MAERLSGRRTLVTGGASGLGAEVVRLFAAEGSSVAIVDLPSAASGAAVLVDDINAAGGHAVFAGVDVRDASAVDAVVDQVVADLGGIDTMVLSAGVSAHPQRQGSFNELLNLDPDHFDFVMDVNLRGVFVVAQRGAQHMVKAAQGGSIVTIASTAAKRPTAGVYSVSKAAVWMLTRCLAQELAAHQIRVNAIGPSYVETALFGDIVQRGAGTDPEAQRQWLAGRVSNIPLGRLGTPTDVAEAALFLASDASSWFTGSILHPDGGFTSAHAGG